MRSRQRTFAAGFFSMRESLSRSIWKQTNVAQSPGLESAWLFDRDLGLRDEPRSLCAGRVNVTAADMCQEDQEAGALIAAAVRADNWLSYARYMEMALYAPGVGYYSSDRRKFGAAGDFVTASGISMLFGATLSRQVVEICAASRPHVLEFGAGTGALAADILNASDAAIETYSILELSPALRRRQQETLAQRAPAHADRVLWLDALPTRFSGCIVANEVLDAMPVHLLNWAADGLLERGVALDGDRLVLADRPAQGAIALAGQALAAAFGLAGGYVSELGLAARAWTRSLADLLDTGAALLIDYGFPACEYYHAQRSSGTLMCHYRHQAIDDALWRPGAADITAHVDFSAIALAGVESGLDLLGYTSQANFLINCGITDLLAATPASDSSAYLPLTNQANRLLSPAEMGELFKVLALGRGIDDSLLGFSRGDRRRGL